MLCSKRSCFTVFQRFTVGFPGCSAEGEERGLAAGLLVGEAAVPLDHREAHPADVADLADREAEAAQANHGRAAQSVECHSGNITGSWSDLSESGHAGQSGGILSWRADRLANMRAFTQGAADPVVAQANFLLKENPQLTQALQNAQSPEEGHRLMADAWKFAGYNRPGGENAARLATTQTYANSFAGGQTLPGVSAPRGGSMGSTAQAGGFGLNGIQGLGSAVTGQVSLTPGVASLSGQPLTAVPESTA
jgi:hypothetical protein